MKKMINKILLILLVFVISTTNNSAQDYQKLAQTGFQFLSVISDARAAAMGDAMTSLQIGSSALFFNPAGMADIQGLFDVTGSTNKWIADITHTTFSAAFNPADGDYGVFGLSAQIVDYGEFERTIVTSDPLGYADLGTFKLTALAVGLGYAKEITDRFSVGGQIKWIRQDLGESTIAIIADGDTSAQTVSNNLSPLVFDFGTQFKTGIESIVFGMSVRNFSKEVQYANEGFQAPLIFTLGISMNVMDLLDELPFDQSLYVCLDASHYRDHLEQIKIGLDYKIMEMFSLRGGYSSSNDENDFSFGLGITKYGFVFDYAYTPFGVFNNVQRFTVRFSM